MLQTQRKQLLWFSVLLAFGLSLSSCSKGESPLNKRKEEKRLTPLKEKPQPPKPTPPKEEKVETPTKIIREKTAYTPREKKELWNTIYRYEVKVSSEEREPWTEWCNYRFLEVRLRKTIVGVSSKKREVMWLELLRSGNNEKLDGYNPYVSLMPGGCGPEKGNRRSIIWHEESSSFSFIPIQQDRMVKDKEPHYTPHLRDLISLKYDPERDVLLLRTKTALFDEDGANPTYELRPREESLVKEFVIPDDDHRTY